MMLVKSNKYLPYRARFHAMMGSSLDPLVLVSFSPLPIWKEVINVEFLFIEILSYHDSSWCDTPEPALQGLGSNLRLK